MKPKSSPKIMKVTLEDLAVLIFNVHLGLQNKEIGFEDAYNHVNEILGEVDRPVKLKREHVESMLWSANLLDERGEFWHPRGMSFEKFTKRLGRKKLFDRRYNLFT